MRTHYEYNGHPRSQRLADLQDKTAQLERELSDARMSLEHELAEPGYGWDTAAGEIHETRLCSPADAGPDDYADWMPDPYASQAPSRGYGGRNSAGQPYSPEGRTEVLVNRGRRTAYSRGLSRGRKIAAGIAVIAVLLTSMVLMLSGGGASWPSSVLTVQNEAARACQNPDVKSEPGQVNFACAQATRQILWVFALMTSGNDPSFADAKTGRVGLEPITPAQGGVVAWSLNLHHPYDPSNPVDSVEVAARAINNIIAGATVIGANGRPVVQPGLENDPANCLRYTGSAAVISRHGFPGLCAKPLTTAGQAALVADVYQRWVVGAAPQAAQDAAVLFGSANNPGDPQVQAILRHLPSTKPLT